MQILLPNFVHKWREEEEATTTTTRSPAANTTHFSLNTHEEDDTHIIFININSHSFELVSLSLDSLKLSGI